MAAKAKAKTASKKTASKASTTKGTTAKNTATNAKSTASKASASNSKSKTTAKTKAKSSAQTGAKKKAAAADSPFRNFTPYQPKKTEQYMNEAQREHFKQILLNWRDELMEEVDRTVHHMQDEAANFPDPADRATQEEEFSIELRTRDRERKLIKKIDQTIERVDQDDYGYCDTCGIEIGLRRLEARPTATQCVDCKSLDEIKERQIHG